MTQIMLHGQIMSFFKLIQNINGCLYSYLFFIYISYLSGVKDAWPHHCYHGNHVLPRRPSVTKATTLYWTTA